MRGGESTGGSGGGICRRDHRFRYTVLFDPSLSRPIEQNSPQVSETHIFPAFQVPDRPVRDRPRRRHFPPQHQRLQGGGRRPLLLRGREPGRLGDALLAPQHLRTSAHQAVSRIGPEGRRGEAFRSALPGRRIPHRRGRLEERRVEFASFSFLHP